MDIHKQTKITQAVFHIQTLQVSFTIQKGMTLSKWLHIILSEELCAQTTSQQELQ